MGKLLSNYLKCLDCGKVFYFGKGNCMILNNKEFGFVCPSCQSSNLDNVPYLELERINQEQFNPSRKDKGELKD